MLTETGHHDVAFAVATQTTESSWGFWTYGAKFTPSANTDRRTRRSRNHHFFGAVVQGFYEDLAGIRPLEPGFRVIEFKPEVTPKGLDAVSASYESVCGTVSTRWRRTAAGLELDVDVPPNATGRVYMPAPGPRAVSERGGGEVVAADRPPSVKHVGVEGGRVVHEVVSGQYRFRVVNQGTRGGR